MKLTTWIKIGKYEYEVDNNGFTGRFRFSTW